MLGLTLELSRWIVRRDGPPNAVQRALISERVSGALVALNEWSLSRYVSRQRGHDVWLTVVATVADGPAIREGVRANLGPDIVEEFTTQDDALVSSEARRYREGLHHVTDLSLELLLAPNFRAHQRALVLMLCLGAVTPIVLETYCLAHSDRHRGLSADQRVAFWEQFFLPGPGPGLSCYGHWLWNILVGPQPQPGDDPWPLLAAIGAV